MRPKMAAGAYARPALGYPEKVCENLYFEESPVDPQRPNALFRIPGSLKITEPASNIRGLFQADGHASGKVLIPISASVVTYDPTTGTVSALTGSIAGTDRADFAVSQTEAAILANGSIYISNGSAIAIATDADFPSGITSVASIGQRLLMSAADGKFWYTSVLDFDDITALNFYTAELKPDDLVAIRVFGADILLFGTRSIEWWAQTGNDDDPFAWQNGRAIDVGALCRDGIANLDGVPYFVAHDRTVRRIRDGSNAEVISNAGIAKALESVAASDVIGGTYSYRNHVFYVLSLPTITYVFDVATSEWHRAITLGEDFWRWVFFVRAGSKNFVAARADVKFAELSKTYLSDYMPNASTMGTEIASRTNVFLPVTEGEIEVVSVRLEVSHGVGLATGQGSDPVALMRMSKPGDPNNFYSSQSRRLGVQGKINQKTIWWRCGRVLPPGATIEFLISDPVDLVISGVAINED